MTRVRFNPKVEQRIFMRRTYSIYKHMAERVGKLAFSLDTLRRAMHPQLGKPCPFCKEALRAKNFSLDHADPLSRGGSKAMANLRMICGPCNRAKGDLTWREFQRLCDFLQNLGKFAKTSVFRRLKSSPFWLR